MSDNQGGISSWRNTEQKSVFVAYVEVNQLTRFAANPDSSRIYTANATGEISVWDARDQIEFVATIDQLDERVTALDLGKQGSLLAVGTEGGRVHLYEISDGSTAKRLEFPGNRESEIWSLVRTANGCTLATMIEYSAVG